jgi:hypothetical protein
MEFIGSSLVFRSLFISPCFVKYFGYMTLRSYMLTVKCAFGRKLKGLDIICFKACSSLQVNKIMKNVVTTAGLLAYFHIRYLQNLKLCCVETQIWKLVFAEVVFVKISTGLVHAQFTVSNWLSTYDFLCPVVKFPMKWNSSSVNICGLFNHMYRNFCISGKRWVNTLQIQTWTSQISHSVVNNWTQCAEIWPSYNRGPKTGWSWKLHHMVSWKVCSHWFLSLFVDQYKIDYWVCHHIF